MRGMTGRYGFIGYSILQNDFLRQNDSHSLPHYMTLGDVPNKQRKVSPFKTSNSASITLTLFCFNQNLHPASPVPGELQERLPLMAALGQMPDMPGKEMSVGACHAYQPAYNVFFDLKTDHLRLFFGPFFTLSYSNSTS